MWWFEALLMANEPKKICLGPKALFFLSSHSTHLETYSYYENVPMVPNETLLQLMQLSFNYILKYWWVVKCNYIASYAAICNLCNYIATISYATICNYATCNLCNLSNFMNLCKFTKLYATLRNLCNNATYATICNYATCLMFFP